MSVQTSYSLDQPLAYAGLVYAQAPKDILSLKVETAAGIGFGLAVSRGTDPDTQAVIGGAAFIGVTVRELNREGAANTGAIEYAEKETAGVLRDGYIWATCPTGCVPGDSVNYNDTTGVLDSGAAGAGETDIAGATWETTAAAGQLAVVRIKS